MQRGPIIAFALVGFFISRYLASYQLGHIQYPWDPFFRDGTQRVLDSEVSRAFPVSDAGLGAVSYMLEALSGFMGGRNRWRTMPWMVAMFGVLVVPLGVVSILLVILQPVAVGAWCTLCLVTAVAMLVMIAPAVDEVVAMGQFLRAARRDGKPLWRTFWLGGTMAPGAAERDAGSPPDRRSLAARVVAALDLDNVPPTLMLSVALGVWLMMAPAVLGGTGEAARWNQVAGALAITWAVIAFGEIVRPVRLLNVAVGVTIAVEFLLRAAEHGSSWLVWNSVAVGLALAALSVPRGRIDERFGRWNHLLV
jgi:hypothetical protein